MRYIVFAIAISSVAVSCGISSPLEDQQEGGRNGEHSTKLVVSEEGDATEAGARSKAHEGKTEKGEGETEGQEEKYVNPTARDSHCEEHSDCALYSKVCNSGVGAAHLDDLDSINEWIRDKESAADCSGGSNSSNTHTNFAACSQGKCQVQVAPWKEFDEAPSFISLSGNAGSGTKRLEAKLNVAYCVFEPKARFVIGEKDDNGVCAISIKYAEDPRDCDAVKAQEITVERSVSAECNYLNPSTGNSL